MKDEKEIKTIEKKTLAVSLLIAKEKQGLAGECYMILKIAAIKTKQKFNDKDIADKIYKEIKAVNNEKIKKLFKLKGEEKKGAENKILKEILRQI